MVMVCDVVVCMCVHRYVCGVCVMWCVVVCMYVVYVCVVYVCVWCGV